MVEPSTDPIAIRNSKLNQIVRGKGQRWQFHLANQESLLDALFLLYDECNSDHMQKDKHVNMFVNKYRAIVNELKRLRVNANDFDVKKIIGRGHFGEVQLVQEKRTGDIYAMKTLRKSDTLAQENVAFYEEERDIMVNAQSPWLTQLHYAFQNTHNLYLVMEFHPGGDLLSLMNRSDDLFSEDMARFYVAEIALAINSLHGMGYVHRDVKPDNVLIDRLGHVKLADFGSAVKLSDSKKRMNMPVGTADYIAPEALLALNTNQDVPYDAVKADWWSLGIVAFEMLFGRTPFSDEKSMATYNNIMNHKKTFKWPDDISVSKDAKSIISGLLEDASERMDYHQIIKHPFFSSVDFNNMRNTVPPFIPQITSQDDTSNFDEFEKQVPVPTIDDLMTKKGFCGKNLPFIGFTHTQTFESKSDRISVSVCSPQRVSLDLSNKNQQIAELQHKIHVLEQGETSAKAESAHLRKRLLDKESQFSHSDSRRDEIERELQELITENKRLKRQFEVDQAEQLNEGKRAVEMFVEAKLKWKKKEESYKNALKERSDFIKEFEVKFYKCRANELKLQQKLNREQEESSNAELLVAENEKLKKLLERKKRESVDGFQSLLTEVTETKEFEIAELNQRVSDVEEQKKKLEKSLKAKESELSKLQDDHGSLTKQVETLKHKLEETKMVQSLQEIDKSTERESLASNLQDHLNQEKENTKELHTKLKALEERVKNDFQMYEGSMESFRRKEEEMIVQMQNIEQSMKESANEKIKLQCELEEFEKEGQENEEKIQDLLKKIQEMQEKLDSADETSKSSSAICQKSCCNASGDGKTSEASSDSQQHTKYLEEKVDKLQSQLESTREVFAKERQKCKQIQDELYKMQKELSNTALDSRIAQREAKKFQEKIATLEKQLSERDHQIKEKMDTLAAMQEKEKCLCQQIDELKEEVLGKKKDMEHAERKFEVDRSKLEEKIRGLEDANCAQSSLKSELGKTQGQYEELSKQKLQLEIENKSLRNDKQSQNEQLLKFESQLDEKTKCCQRLDLNVQALKAATNMIESQLEAYETLVENHEATEARLKEERKEMQASKQKIEEELVQAQISLDKEKMQREMLQSRLQEMEAHTSTQKVSHTSEVKVLRGELREHKEANMKYNDLLTETERKLCEVELAVRNLQSRYTALEDETIRLKEEAAGLITSNCKLTDEKFALTIGLEDAIGKCEMYNLRNEELENHTENMQENHNTEMIKLRSQISQQAKLIEFMQKSTPLSKKKKTLQEKIFGRNIINVESSPLLSPKGSHARKSKSVSTNSRAEPSSSVNVPTTPQSKAILSAIVQSPGNQQVPELGKESFKVTEERMRHKIPHRFQVVLNPRAAKCAACLDTLHFGRNVSKCIECDLIVHSKCASALPSTCGLPSGLMQHFRQSLRKKENRALKQETTNTSDRLDGWLKVLGTGNGSWEERFVRLVDDKLHFYDKENHASADPADELDLCPPDGEVIVHSAVSSSDLANTVKSDLPFILKLEVVPATTCWPSRVQYIMATGFTVKQKWVEVLESITVSHATKCNRNRDAKLYGEVVLHLENDEVLDVNCVVHYGSETLLLGTEEGLFVCSLNDSPRKTPRHIKGIDCVFQMSIVPSLNCLILISENERILNLVDLGTFGSVLNSSNGELPFTAIQPIDGVCFCHLFSFAHVLDTYYICAATADSVIILKWHEGTQNFAVQKEFRTSSEPCSCILFRTHSVLVGTNKYFEIDLQELTVEEFLDPSDTSLASVVFNAVQMANSFPVAVLLVSPPSAPEEFLLCFHEFGLFVDGFGRRTRRGNMKWTRLPLAFTYQAPYLFVAHFNSLEVAEIPPVKDKHKSKHTFLDFHGPRYLGPSMDDGSIYLASVRESNVDVFCLRSSLMSKINWVLQDDVSNFTEDCSLDDVASCDFSITSSLVQALEGSPDEESLSSTESIYKDTAV